MNIAFDPQNIYTQNQKMEQTRQTPADQVVASMGAGISFQAGTPGGMMAYGSESKDFGDIAQDMSMQDVKVTRNYLTVMSNTMSEEDFQKLKEGGIDPTDVSVEDSVTIMDHIKTALALGGTQVEGFTTDLDEEAVKEITGSGAVASELVSSFENKVVEEGVVFPQNIDTEQQKAVDIAVSKMENITSLSDGAKKYLLEHQLTPTIDHLYQASFSTPSGMTRQAEGYYAAGEGYFVKKADASELDGLTGQLEQTIQKAGLIVDQETMGEAKWLIARGEPCTPELVGRLHEINQITLPVPREELVSMIEIAVEDGKQPGETNLADPRSYRERAEQGAEVIAAVTTEEAMIVLGSGRKLTIDALRQELEKRIGAGERLSKDSMQAEGEKEDFAQEVLAGQSESPDNTSEQEAARAQLVLQEARLRLTVSANLSLLRSGISLETESLEYLVEELRDRVEQQERRLFGGEDEEPITERKALFVKTEDALKRISQAPAAVLARFRVESPDFTLDEIAVQGSKLRREYENAGRSYETLMTAPRADLGDRIENAFRNIDAILEEIGMEPLADNEKAVRILGYNGMELSEENIENVKEADQMLRSVVGKMTPGAVLKMIRDQVNPLETTIPQLEEYLKGQEKKSGQKVEKYSNFLYRLEQSGQISEEERSSYIGIYRLLSQLDKTDDAAVGALLRSGQDVTFKNLLAALRSTSHQGSEYLVDDSFGGMNGIRQNASISEQIEAAYTVSDDTINTLLQSGLPVTPKRLSAMEELQKNRTEWFRGLYRNLSAEDQETIQEVADAAVDQMSDAENLEKALETALGQMTDTVLEAMEQSDTLLDIRGLQNVFRQITLLRERPQEDHYDIPVVIGGEPTTIHLELIRDSGHAGEMAFSTKTEQFGEVAGLFRMGEHVSGYLAFSNAAGRDSLQQKMERLKEETGITVTIINNPELNPATVLERASAKTSKESVRSRKSDAEAVNPSQENAENADILYKSAKALIRSLQEDHR